jgi:F0F1-type ATP synthase epsilon subunit
MADNDQTSDPSATTPTTNGSSVNQSKKIQVHISTPDEILYEGEAEAITTMSETGIFDILPLHENYIALIKNKVTVYIHRGGDKREFPMEKGVIKVQKNKVTVLTGFEVLEAQMPQQAAEDAATEVETTKS